MLNSCCQSSYVQFRSVTQSCLTLRPHELQHARPNLEAITLYPWDFFFFFVANFIYFLFFLFLNNVHLLLNSD